MKDHHLHLCEAIAPEQKDPCEDIGKALKHDHSLVPGIVVFFLTSLSVLGHLVRSVKRKTRTRKPR